MNEEVLKVVLLGSSIVLIYLGIVLRQKRIILNKNKINLTNEIEGVIEND